MNLEPLPDVKVGEQDGWCATGKRRDRKRVVEEMIGVFASWLDADQACDHCHRQHGRHSLTSEINKHYRKEEAVDLVNPHLEHESMKEEK